MRDVGQLHAADGEGGEDRARRQRVHERQQRRAGRPARRRGCPGRAGSATGSSISPSRISSFTKTRWPVSKTSSSGCTPSSRTCARHRAQHRGRVDHHVVAACREVHRAAVERADLGPQLGDVRQPLRRAGHVGSRRVERERGLDAAEHEVAAHAGGQVEHDVDARRADALHHLAVEARGRAAALPVSRVAHVDVRDRGARPRGLDAPRPRSARA